MSFYHTWKREKLRIIFLVFALSFVVIGTTYFWFRSAPQSVSAITFRVNSAVDAALSARKDFTHLPGDTVDFGDDATINILILGIDSRKEGREQHCDAIHMVSVDTRNWTVLMTSVPRGTYAYIPPGTYAKNEYYLANACAFAGLDYGVEQIERVVGVKADYVVTAGFSQVLGILRTLSLPTTESLQWLRNRQSYALGDPQRSQNQAVFLKDVALRLLGNDGIPNVLFHLLYSFVDTEMSEETAKALYDGLLLHNIHDRPEAIVLAMKPHYAVKDIHFDPERSGEQIAKLLAKLQGRLSSSDFSRRTLEEVQKEFVVYLENVLVGKEGSVDAAIDQQLWLQVEDDGVRESLHYRFVEAYAKEMNGTDHEAAIQFIADYILEKQTLGALVWETKGRELLEAILK